MAKFRWALANFVEDGSPYDLELVGQVFELVRERVTYRDEMVQQGDVPQLSLSKPLSVLGLLNRMNGDSISDRLHQARRAASNENPETMSSVGSSLLTKI